MKKVFFILCLFMVVDSYAQNTPCACCDTTYRQFDFWVGEWTVTDSTGKHLGDNKIELVQNSCSLKENWTGANGFTGMSISFYERRAKQWNQVWVDQQGGSLKLTGAFEEDRMVMTTPKRINEETGLYTQNKISWIILPNGVVRHLWEQTTDSGKSWTVAFDGYYRKKN